MRKIIKEGEAGVLWRNGIIKRRLEPGKHHYGFWRGERVETISTLSTDFLAQTAEYTTSDSLVVRFSIHARIKVVDPIILRKTMVFENVAQYVPNLLADEARKIVRIMTLDEIVSPSDNVDETLFKNCNKILAASGLGLEAISPLIILIPRSLRQAFEAELTAKKRAIADLEEARGRTATLRHLANAADIVEKRPILMQLLLGQKARNIQFQFDQTSKNTKK